MTKQRLKPSPQADPNPEIAEALHRIVTDDTLACADAFTVARELRIRPLAVGETADVLSIRLARCQLGLFGYPGKQGWQSAGVTTMDVPAGLEEAISEARGPDGHLSCAVAWLLADRFGAPRMQVGWVAERLGIKIASCQLGAF